jgi:exosortase/archaeosortase family protein
MNNFRLLYIFYIPTLFIAFYFNTNDLSIFLNSLSIIEDKIIINSTLNIFFYTDIISNAVNDFQKDTTLYFLSLFFEDRISNDYIIISDSYRLFISKACNGLIPFLFFVASVLAYHSSIQCKILWLIIGYIVILFANILRIAFVTQMVVIDQQNFLWAHDYIGNMFLLLLGLSLFFLFIQNSTRTLSVKKAYI